MTNKPKMERGTFRERKKGLRGAITATRRTRRRRRRRRGGVAKSGIDALTELPEQGWCCHVTSETQRQNPQHNFQRLSLLPVHLNLSRTGSSILTHNSFDLTLRLNVTPRTVSLTRENAPTCPCVTVSIYLVVIVNWTIVVSLIGNTVKIESRVEMKKKMK